MQSKFQDLGISVIGFLSAGITSFHLYEEYVFKGIISVMTAFIGGGAAILGKMFVIWIKEKLTKK